MNLSCYKTPYKYIYILKRPRKHNLNRFMWSYYAALIYYEYQSEREFKLYRVYICIYTYQVVLVDQGVLRILQLQMVPRSKTLLYLGRLYHPCHPAENNVASINGRLGRRLTSLIGNLAGTFDVLIYIIFNFKKC